MQETISDYVLTEHSIIKEFCNVFDKSKVAVAEQSVKIIKDSMTKDRVLIGVPSHRISYDTLVDMLKGFNFPMQLKSMLDEYYYSNTIIFGLEVFNGKINHRIYFERDITLAHVKLFAELQTKSAETINSIKWNYEIPEEYNLTRYFLQVKNVDMYDIESAVRNSGFNYIPKFVKSSKNKKIYLYEAVDENTDRKSFYVSIDDIYLRDLRIDIQHLSNPKIYNQLEEFSEFEISNFGGGISKNGQKFYNIYFTMYKEDA